MPPPKKGHKWREFEEAVAYARNLDLKSTEEWRTYCKSGDKPADIPATPHKTYKDEWKGFGYFLGTGKPSVRRGGWREFDDALRDVRKLKLKSQKQWNEYCKSGNKPDDIPSTPDRIYKGKGWKNYGHWLGTGKVKQGDQEYLPVEEAREHVQSLGFKGVKEYREWAKSDAKPANVPSRPELVYWKKAKGMNKQPEGYWRGWADWLGIEPNVWTRGALMRLLEDLRPQLEHLDEATLYTILQQGRAYSAFERVMGAKGTGAALHDLMENEGRELEDAIQQLSDDAEIEVEGIVEDIPEAEVPAENGLQDDTHAVEDTADDFLLKLVTNDELKAIDNTLSISSLGHGLDDEAAEFIVGNKVAKLWQSYVTDGDEVVTDALSGDGGHYFNTIRDRFYTELEAVETLPIPDSWSFEVNGVPQPPNSMQRRTAWSVLTKGRVGNWSGVGAGKTLSAILASRVVDAKATLVIANNSTLDTWTEQIRAAFLDSVVHVNDTRPAVDGRHNYYIVNYERFQQANRNELVHAFLDIAPEFAVLDEIQMVKQRNQNEESRRRKAVSQLLGGLAESNLQFRVLGMSATPVMNELLEPRKLLELITGQSYDELSTKATVSNAFAMHRSLMLRGFRYRPNYKIEAHEEYVPVDGLHLLDDLRHAKMPLDIEKTQVNTKLQAVLPYIKKGTVVYTQYVDGIVHPIREYLEDQGFSVGIYTGDDKSGIEAFKAGKLDVLIGSSAISTGVDGLQKVADTIVYISLPWTGSADEQVRGRLRRQGSAFSKVTVVIPQVVLGLDSGDEWSYDRYRMSIIERKRTLSDCVIDGRAPEAIRMSGAELVRRSAEALEEWIERVQGDGVVSIPRQQLRVPLPPNVRERVQRRTGDFTKMNASWGSSYSNTLNERLRSNPEEWFMYHTLYREARAGWEEVPASYIATRLSTRPDWKVADFGCGEGLLAKALPEHEVIGFDHVGVDDTVIECDMANAPVPNNEFDAVVFSLSLMGRNWTDYIVEAHRILKHYGKMFITETAKRWEDGELEQTIQQHGFEVTSSYKRTDFRYIVAEKVW
jgi:superfamily II DNA or RNA helicase